MTPEERADILVKAWHSTLSARLNKKATQSLLATMSAGMNAAHIEGMREALKLMRQANFYAEGVELILAEIAALERGKDQGR